MPKFGLDHSVLGTDAPEGFKDLYSSWWLSGDSGFPDLVFESDSFDLDGNFDPFGEVALGPGRPRKTGWGPSGKVPKKKPVKPNRVGRNFGYP